MSDPMLRTWDLVRSAQAGDARAIDDLFARYYERVRRAVRARIGAKLRAWLETADILQPAFAKAFQNFDRFEMRHEGSLLHWLAEYAQRQMLDAADRENAAKRQAPGPVVRLDASDDDHRGLRHDVADRGPSPATRAAGDERAAAVEACLDELPEHFRAVIVLRDYDGLEWVEVAERLGKPTDSAARQMHRRALLELAALLSRRGVGPDAP